MFQVAPDYSCRYEFVANHTGSPVSISGKRHWRRYLKENGLTDNVAFSEKGGTLKNRAPELMAEKLTRQLTKGVEAGIRKARTKSYFDKRLTGGM